MVESHSGIQHILMILVLVVSSFMIVKESDCRRVMTSSNPRLAQVDRLTYWYQFAGLYRGFSVVLFFFFSMTVR